MTRTCEDDLSRAVLKRKPMEKDPKAVKENMLNAVKENPDKMGVQEWRRIVQDQKK